MNKIFQKEYQKLNSQQKKAVDEIEGPIMVIAGPGTGKTQIVAMRIANILLKTQIDPSNILCLTFTNSGVQAMKKRLLEIIGASSYQIHIHTFHSFCNEIILTFPEKFLTANIINQLTNLEQIELIQKILKENNLSTIKPIKSPFHYQRTIINAINSLKQEDISPDEFNKQIEQELKNLKNLEDLYHEKGPYRGKVKAKHQNTEEQLHKNRELGQVYSLYEDYLRKNGKYDYADMILFVVNRFKTDKELLAYYQEKFQYILVDEYQDTNSAQNKVIELLGSFYENPNIFVVGDDEQSIFRFQGASLENILFFQKKYPETKTIILKNNYRSGQNILNASRELILKNTQQLSNQLKIPKKLLSQLPHIKGEIFLGEFSESTIENYFIVKEIQRLIKKKIPPQEIAVLYKEHKDAEELIDFLSKLDIPYRLEVGDNVLKDTEIKKLLKYIEALNLDHNLNELLVEIMHYSYFNISPLDIWKVIMESRKQKKTIFEIISKPSKYLKDLETLKKIEEFYDTFIACRRYSFNHNLVSSFEYIINSSGYLRYLISLKDNVRHFNRLQSLFEYIKIINTKEKNLNLEKFLEHIRLLTENEIVIREREITAEYEGINLMTAHKAKGLEFQVVFMTRLIDGHWGNKTKRELIKLPTALVKNQIVSAQLKDEEERRLFYVGMTRAKHRLYLTYALSYNHEENKTLAIPSRFISELPKKYLKKIDSLSYEKSLDARLNLAFSEKKWERTQAMSDFLKKLIEDFSLNPTALNAYLECPKRFLCDNILRVPKAKTFDQAYGTAIHKALQDFFNQYIKTLRLPTKKWFISFYHNALKEEILSNHDLVRAKKRGTEILSQYYEFYKDTWKKSGRPLLTEFNFARDNVHFENIPITGKVDRIDLIDKTSSTIKIVDYKTSAPKSLNYVLGKTKEKDLSLLYQGYFYKLLCESDPLFNWRVGEIEFDFISPEKNKFRKVSLPIDQKDFDNFKKTIEEVYKKIIAQEFNGQTKSCQSRKGSCPYIPIC